MRRIYLSGLFLLIFCTAFAFWSSNAFASSTQSFSHRLFHTKSRASIPAYGPGQYSNCYPYTYMSGNADGSGTGNGCTNANFPWKYTTGGNATWSVTWPAGINEGRETSMHLWVYIPNNHAGAPHARYDVYIVSRDGTSTQWLGWVGHYINQNNVSGWIDLGNYNNTAGSNYYYFRVVTTNHDDYGVSGWEMAAAAISFNITQ